MHLMTPSNLLLSENLVNCWLREGLPFTDVGNHQLVLHLSPSESLRVTYLWQSALQDVRLSSPVTHNGRPLGARELIELMATFVKDHNKATNDRPPDWLENFEDSARHLNMLLEKSVDVRHDTKTFIASEQSLQLGHRFHPSPKSRIGFSPDDVIRYSPEWNGQFPLRYIEIPREQLSIRGNEDFLRFWQNKIQAALAINTDAIIFPVHPWSARHGGDRFLNALRDGGWTDLGEIGPNFHPTSSVRTLYWSELSLFLKTSLDIRITNCYRRNQSLELDAIATLNPIIDRLLIANDRFRVLHEPLSLDLKHHEDLFLGVIFREGLTPELEMGWTPLLAASLFGDRDFSVARMIFLLSGQSVESWFTKYCECLVPPIMDAFWQRGLMSEPHLQNTLVALQDGRPRRLILRDLDNMKLIHGHPYIQGMNLPQESDDLYFDLELGWKRLIYCLIVNHLAESVATLSLVGSGDQKSLERELWAILARTLRNCDIPASRKNDLLGTGSLWSKKNFFTRVTRTQDLTAPFAPIPNPLCKTQ